MSKNVDHETNLARALAKLGLVAETVPPDQAILARLVLLTTSVTATRIEMLEAKIAALVEKP